MTLEEATKKARVWAKDHQRTSVFANAALAYIDAIAENRAEGRAIGQSQLQADRTQYIYIISNLQPWRGEEAREAKKVMRAFIKRKS